MHYSVNAPRRDERVKDGDEKVNTKEVIFEQALRIFSEKGFERATIEEIADQAGIAKGTFYYHFKSKSELFEFLLQQGTHILMDNTITALQKGGTVVERLEAVINELLSFFQDYQEFCRMIFSEILGPAAAPTRWEDIFKPDRQKYLLPVIELIREGQEQGIIRNISPQTALQAILGTISTIAMTQIFHGEHFDKMKVSSQIREILFHGILVA
jgi:AcrR family transcriptional regulator